MQKFQPNLSLVILWLGILINNFIWLKKDITYFTYDSHRHFLASLRMFEIFKNFSCHAIPPSIDTIYLHPPFVTILTALFYFLFGISQDIALITNNAIFMGILIFAIYKIGLKIADTKTALLAAFIVSMYPVVFNQLKVYMLDLPLAAMVTLAVYFLFCCDNFKNFKYSVFFGISAGLGMLTKDTFFLFLIGPWSYVVIKSIFVLRQKSHNFKKYAGHLVLSGTLIVLISFPYYLSKIFILLGKLYPGYVRTWPVSTPELNLFLEKVRALLWYLWGFINWQASFFLFLIFLIGLFFFSVSKIKNKGIFISWILVSWLFIGYFRYAIGFNMEVTGVRYTMPILPALALISAFGITHMRVKRISVFLTYAVVIFGILQLFFVSYPVKISGFPTQIFLPVKLPWGIDRYRLFPEKIVLLNFEGWAVSGRSVDSYPKNLRGYFLANEEIFKTINSSKGDLKTVSVFVIPDDAQLWYLQYMAYSEKKPFRIFCDWNYLRIDITRGKTAIPELILKSDYIIDKNEGFLGEPYLLYWVRASKDYLNLYKDKFMLLKKVKWLGVGQPDGSFILIYKNLN